MKILIINTVPTRRNGITNVIFNLLENMTNQEFQIGYVSINHPNDDFKERLKRQNCQLYVVPRKKWGIISYIKTVSKISKNYDVVHVHGNSATLAIDFFAAVLGGIKFRIAHSHTTSCKMIVTDKILRPFFYKLCNGRLACGTAAGKWLYGDRDFEVIQNGINTARFRFNKEKRNEIRKSLGWKDNIVIGHIGNFEEVKNHKFIFDIFKYIVKEDMKIRLICVGNGKLMEEFKNYIEKLDLNTYIYLTGSVNNPEDYMSAMDLVLMPSIHEGLPLSLVEEQANGLKCIVSDVITKEADLTGNLYFLPLKASKDIWKDVIIDTIAHLSYDRDLVSEKCISLIKEKGFDISSETQKLSDIYRNVDRKKYRSFKSNS